MHHQEVVGEHDFDNKDHSLRKQAGLSLSREKTYVKYMTGERQSYRYPDNEKHSCEGKG
jgi:hypothetical protein